MAQQKRDRKTKEQYRQDLDELRGYALQLALLLTRATIYLPDKNTLVQDARVLLRTYDTWTQEQHQKKEPRP